MRRRRNFTGVYVVIILAIVFLGVQFWRLAAHPASEDEPSATETAQEEAPAPEPAPLFAEYYEQAAERIRDMSLEAKVAQLFLVRFPEDDELSAVAAAEPGGFILFARDFQYETPASIQTKLQSLQDAAAIDFLLGVDEEGGTVTRVSRFPAYRSAKFAAPQELYHQGGLDLVIADAHEKSALLTSLGLNLNLAPVADVPTSPNSFIYARSLGADAAETARYVAAVVTAMQDDGMISAMKHFPGYGDNADTHTGVAIDTRSYDELLAADLLPFISGIAAGGPAILVSHNVITAVDPANPASLSSVVINILRNDLGFTGVIITDDLAMGAVREHGVDGSAAVAAVLAGDDLLITSDFFTERQEVLDAVSRGIIDEARLDTSLQRILALKLAYGLL